MLRESKVYKNTKVYAVDMNKNASGKHFADYFYELHQNRIRLYVHLVPSTHLDLQTGRR